MCFKTNPGCTCCKTLPIYRDGVRKSLNTNISSSLTWSPLFRAIVDEVYDPNESIGSYTNDGYIFSRSWDVVYVRQSSATIRQLRPSDSATLWTSSAASTTVPSATSALENMSIGEFGFVGLTTSTTFSSSTLFWIDKDGTWVFEPTTVVEVVAGAATITDVDMIRFSPNSMHAAVQWLSGTTWNLVAGDMTITAVTGGLRITVASDITRTLTSVSGMTRQPNLGADASDNLYLAATGPTSGTPSFCKIVLPGASIDSTSGTANICAAPGGYISYTYTNGGTNKWGIVPRVGSSIHQSVAGTIMVPIVSGWACDLVATPSAIKTMFPSLVDEHVDDIPTESGNIDLKKYYFNNDLTYLRRRVIYNFGSIMQTATGFDGLFEARADQVLVQDDVSTHDSVFLGVTLNDLSGTEYTVTGRDEVFELTTADAEFHLLLSSGGGMTNFGFADLRVYQFRYDETVTSTNPFIGDDPTITFDAIDASNLTNIDADEYTLTVENVDGGKGGGALTITVDNNTDAYKTSNTFPLNRVPMYNQWYYVPRSSFVCDITRAADSEDLAGTTAEFEVYFYAEPLDVTADDFVAAVTGDVTAGTISISSAGKRCTVSVASVAGGVGGGTIGLNLAGGHNITSTQAPFTLTVDEDETYNVAAD